MASMNEQPLLSVLQHLEATVEQEGALHDGANRFVLPPFIAEQQQAAGIDEVIFDSSISILSCSSSLLQNRPWSSAPPSLSGAASPKRDESEFRGLKKATSFQGESHKLQAVRCYSFSALEEQQQRDDDRSGRRSSGLHIAVALKLQEKRDLPSIGLGLPPSCASVAHPYSPPLTPPPREGSFSPFYQPLVTAEDDTPPSSRRTSVVGSVASTDSIAEQATRRHAVEWKSLPPPPSKSERAFLRKLSGRAGDFLGTLTPEDSSEKARAEKGGPGSVKSDISSGSPPPSYHSVASIGRSNVAPGYWCTGSDAWSEKRWSEKGSASALAKVDLGGRIVEDKLRGVGELDKKTRTPVVTEVKLQQMERGSARRSQTCANLHSVYWENSNSPAPPLPRLPPVLAERPSTPPAIRQRPLPSSDGSSRLHHVLSSPTLRSGSSSSSLYRSVNSSPNSRTASPRP